VELRHRPPALVRAATLARFVARDARSGAEGRTPDRAGSPADPLAAAIAWLELTHEATGRRGSSKGYSLLHGWLPAYPETTGYVIGTLLEHSRRTGDPETARRAREMGDWEEEVQLPDGGVMEGAMGTEPVRSIIFNTGMVLHGWVDLMEAGHEQYNGAALRAAQLLTRTLHDDGTWSAVHEYGGIPHTYNSRVAWAMLRFGILAGDEETVLAARRQLDWVLDRQQKNGWFASCVFRPGMTPTTHGIAYTLRGLLESHALTGGERYLEAAESTSAVLMGELHARGRIPANWTEDWRPGSRHECLTGTVQLGGVWLRLFQITGERKYLEAGVKAVEVAVAFQEQTGPPEVRGALAGSSPIWGRYAPLQYPNWATKFAADSLMLKADCLG
jgi:hypothetical protein